MSNTTVTLPARLPRRVDTTVLRAVPVTIPFRARLGMRGNGFNYRAVSGQALYAFNAPRV